MIWLHCVGRLYYSTPNKFIREALRYGITRRISSKVLRKMSLYDEVFLSTLEGKGQLVFGKFEVSGVSGLTDEAVNYLREKGVLGEKISEGGDIVVRGCGSYIEGPSYKLESSIAEVGKIIEESKIKTPLMVIGIFKPVENFILKDVPFRPGFRPFDYEAVKSARPFKVKRGLSVYAGQFYPERVEIVSDIGGEAKTVFNYARKEEA